MTDANDKQPTELAFEMPGKGGADLDIILTEKGRNISVEVAERLYSVLCESDWHSKLADRQLKYNTIYNLSDTISFRLLYDENNPNNSRLEFDEIATDLKLRHALLQVPALLRQTRMLDNGCLYPLEENLKRQIAPANSRIA